MECFNDVIVEWYEFMIYDSEITASAKIDLLYIILQWQE